MWSIIIHTCEALAMILIALLLLAIREMHRQLMAQVARQQGDIDQLKEAWEKQGA